MNVLGLRERNRANYAKALEYQLKALELLTETPKIRDKAIILNNIVLVYKILYSFAHATEYHLNALKLAEQIKMYQLFVFQLIVEVKRTRNSVW